MTVTMVASLRHSHRRVSQRIADSPVHIRLSRALHEQVHARVLVTVRERAAGRPRQGVRQGGFCDRASHWRRHIYTEHLVLKCAIPCRCRTAGSGTHFVTDYLSHMGLGEVSHEQPRPKNDILVSWPTRQPHALGRPAHVDYASLGFPKAAGIYLVMICRTRRSSLLKRRRVTVDCASLGVSRRRSRVPG